MSKLTLAEVNSLFPALSVLTKKKLPVRISYALSRNVERLKSEYELYEKGRLELVNKYCEKDEQGQPIIEGNHFKFEGTNMQEFNNEFQEYLTTEIDFNVYKVDESELFKLEDERYDVLTGEELGVLQFIIKEEDVQNEQDECE